MYALVCARYLYVDWFGIQTQSGSFLFGKHEGFYSSKKKETGTSVFR